MAESRRAHREASRVFAEACERLGVCEGVFVDSGYTAPCYETTFCAICSEKQPLWQAMFAASNAAGAALRTAMRHGDKIKRREERAMVDEMW